MCSTTARCSGSPRRASGCAARSGICPGCSTAPSASTSRSRRRPKPIAGLALQGPTSFAVLRAAGFAGVERLKLFDLAEFPHEGGAVTISRTGFTGDLGYELFVPADRALSLWDRLFEAGEMHGIRAIGYTRAQPRPHRGRADRRQCRFRHRRARASAPTGCACPTRSGWASWSTLDKGAFQRPPRHPRSARRNADAAACAGRAGDRRQHARPSTPSSITQEDARSGWSAPPSGRRWPSATSPSPAWRGRSAIRSSTTSGSRSTRMRELQYQKLMKRAKIVPRPFIKLDRRSGTRVWRALELPAPP